MIQLAFRSMICTRDYEAVNVTRIALQGRRGMLTAPASSIKLYEFLACFKITHENADIYSSTLTDSASVEQKVIIMVRIKRGSHILAPSTYSVSRQLCFMHEAKILAS